MYTCVENTTDTCGRATASTIDRLNFLSLFTRSRYVNSIEGLDSASNGIVHPVAVQGPEFRKGPEIASFANTFSQTNLENFQYGDLSSLESDLKRMVQNAKEFNETGSKVYEDAERIRKAVSNFMPKHNPAYKDKNYRAQPTPIPDASDHEEVEDKPLVPPNKDRTPPMIKLRVNGTAKGKSEGGLGQENPAVPGLENIHEEQLKIVQEMVGLRDPESVSIFGCL